MPERIVLQRTKGYRKPPGAIVVARPTRWGNPFKIGARICTDFNGYLAGFYGIGDEVGYDQGLPVGLSAEQAVAFYRSELLFALEPDPDEAGTEYEAKRLELIAALESLRGHDLACYCPLDQPCHADILLELANAPRTP